MTSLTWAQVQTWRLSQQYLLNRAEPQALIEVVRRISGVQAQLMSAAEWSLGARIESLKPGEVQNALWHERMLIKTWAMRGTLHLLAAGDLPLLVAARQAVTIHRPPSYYTYHGVTPQGVQAILETVPQVLGANPLTREQLAQGIAERAGMPELREVLTSGWGALLKPSAFRGDICFGPNQGQNVTFVHPSQWVSASDGQAAINDPQAALQEIARRYLNAYGPATSEDFARWWGVQPAPAKRVFRSLGDELAAVEVEGWKAWALAASLEQMTGLAATSTVRLLPQFDAFILGIVRDCEPILTQEYKSQVYRPQGWISAVVLIDGQIAGTWETKLQSSRAEVKVDLFTPHPGQIDQSIRSEAERFGRFLDVEVDLVYT